VPLVPVQRFILEQGFEDIHHWNVGALVRSERLDARAVEQALQAILDHHDALRMRFSHGPDGWEQRQSGGPEAVSFEIVEIGDDLGRLTAECERIQASLDLEKGPLFRAALFRLSDGTDRLLVITHHLVNDIVSSKVLGEDLTRGYQQALAGEPVVLPAKTTSYARWAQILEARAPERLEELGYWRETVDAGWPALPLDFDRGPNSFDSADRVRLEIDPEATRALLTGARQTLRMDMPDVLLAAAGRAFGEWTTQPVCGVLIEGHGREDLFDDVDLGRTMGWFTTFYPIRLPAGDGIDWLAHLRRTAETLDAVPHRGLGYGLLRYTLRRPELVGRPLPDVSFNYQGQFGISSSESRFSMARESPGPFVNVRGPRLALLNVECAVFAGRLVVVLVYSRNKHRRDTIAAMADRLRNELGAIAALCAPAAVEVS
jgi:non-ribosomal peptide synthase protein (TIGR01720 family)